MKHGKWFVLAAGLAAASGLAVIAHSEGHGEAPGTITLYNAEAFGGEGVTISEDVPNLQTVTASEGFDGTANDYAFSIRTTGAWEVCMDAGFETRCKIVEGEVSDLGEDGGSISSLRYVGPGEPGRALGHGSEHTGEGGHSGHHGATPPASAAANDDWQPMHNVDLYGNDFREIVYQRAGSDWKTCRASCEADRQCAAWTYVKPGRTEHGECFLKSPIPEASESECCVSGVKGAASTGGAVGEAAIRRGMRRVN